MEFIDPDDNVQSTYIKLDDENLTKILSSIHLKTETEMFVISLNEHPVFYSPDEHLIISKMWLMARLFVKDRQEKNPNFQHYFKAIGNELTITCLNKFYFIAYDDVVFKIRYDKINECKF